MMRHEVAEADGTNPSSLIQLLHRTPRIGIYLCRTVTELLLICRPVNQIQVEIVKPETFKTCLKGRLRLLVSPVSVPKFACNEQLLARHAGYPDSLSYAFFIFINPGRIDMTVAGLDCILHSPGSHCRIGSERTIADARNLNAVFKLNR